MQGEIAKGNNSLAAKLTLKNTHAGWDFHYRPLLMVNGAIPGYFKYEPNKLGQFEFRAYLPNETKEITSNQLKTKPFYWPFKYGDLYDAAKGSAEADKKQVQYELLATAIPALSYAAAANPLDDLANEDDSKDRNFDMMSLKNGGWPAERARGHWHHSDFRDVAMSYTWPMYREMIKQGELDEK